MKRCVFAGLVLAVALPAAAESPCPPPPAEPAADGPIRPGMLHIVPVDHGEVYACWVRQARERWRRGRMGEAEAAFRRALAAVPDGTEALLGLAALALERRRPERARRLYRQVLRHHPDHPLALAGLAMVAGRDRPRLRAALEGLIRRHRDRAPLHYALANLYVREGDWRQAQRSYFEALRLDPDQPDYAYDLAVSLDHLGKYRLAARFYRKALQLARLRRPRFDPAAARRRLAQLEEALP